eukprot:m.93337 g.93337  ORF g.93337 m.93337 type:complete len:161 (+) comp14983_c0_seq11:604-1086(+)
MAAAKAEVDERALDPLVVEGNVPHRYRAWTKLDWLEKKRQYKLSQHQLDSQTQAHPDPGAIPRPDTHLLQQQAQRQAEESFDPTQIERGRVFELTGLETSFNKKDVKTWLKQILPTVDVAYIDYTRGSCDVLLDCCCLFHLEVPKIVMIGLGLCVTLWLE